MKHTFLDNLTNSGIDARKIKASINGIIPYIKNYKILKKQSAASSEKFDFCKRLACLSDFSDQSGVAGGHYFHQDLLIAQRIFQASPIRHIDVGSRVDGFVAHVASFRNIEIADIRAQESTAKNMSFIQADLMGPLPETLSEAADSVSCLHAIEHFGLGRYGDPIDYNGHLKGISNLHGILKPGGTLYLSTPIGPQRIEYNAHRIFNISHLMEILEPLFRITRFSYVDDFGTLHDDQLLSDNRMSNNFGCNYGCGIFEMTKL